jgi:hypothetical protein
MVDVKSSDLLKSLLVLCIGTLLIAVFEIDYTKYSLVFILGGLTSIVTLVNPFNMK